MDELDKANKLIEQALSISLAHQHAKSTADQVSLAQCKDCNIDIHLQRQALGGITRCVECQGYANQERHLKGFV